MNAVYFPLAIRVNVPTSHWLGDYAVDLFAACATPWIAVFDGYAQPLDVPLGGNALVLTAPDGTEAYYAHGLPERASGPVRAGQVIGAVSDSGNARGTGCHLHFAVGQLDQYGAGTIPPWDWLAGVGVADGGGNGGSNGGAAAGLDVASLLVLGLIAGIAFDLLFG